MKLKENRTTDGEREARGVQQILVSLEIKIGKALMAFNKAMIAFLMVSTSACLRFCEK